MTETSNSGPITIRHRTSGTVLFTASEEARALRAAVEEAVSAGANLARANLARANLAGAYLAGAYLDGANLAGAYLDGANLAGANLAGANLAGANLAGANLDGAYLAGAYLDGANLARANLARANLDGAKNAELVIARTRILPEGALVGWKKCADGEIVKLRIPEVAKRSHAFGRKCRAEYAEVLAVYGGNNQTARSRHDCRFIYRVGETVRPDNWCENWADECAGGIHFFITREEAEAY